MQKKDIVGYLILPLSSVHMYNQIHTHTLSLYHTHNYSGDQPKRGKSNSINKGFITIVGIPTETDDLS